jgi:hypothetical protein
MLKRRLNTGATSDGEEDQASENAGESMNLDMKVTALPDGGLSLTTAGKSVTPQTPDEAHSTTGSWRRKKRTFYFTVTRTIRVTTKTTITITTESLNYDVSRPSSVSRRGCRLLQQFR